MKKLLIGLALVAVFSLPSTAFADTIIFTAPPTAPDAAGSAGSNPGGPNQFDLEHHYAYTWQINAAGRFPPVHTPRDAHLISITTGHYPNTLFVACRLANASLAAARSRRP